MRLSSFEPGDGKVLAQAVRGRRRGHAERRGRLSGLLQAPIEPSGAVLSFAAERLASEARGRLSASTLRPTLSKQLDYEGRKAT
jgi:hypothetical protein